MLTHQKKRDRPASTGPRKHTPTNTARTRSPPPGEDPLTDDNAQYHQEPEESPRATTFCLGKGHISVSSDNVNGIPLSDDTIGDLLVRLLGSAIDVHILLECRIDLAQTDVLWHTLTKRLQGNNMVYIQPSKSSGVPGRAELVGGSILLVRCSSTSG